MSGSSGCKMAYGPGPSLTGLSFTPYFAVYMSKFRSDYDYWSATYFGIKGVLSYDSKSNYMAICNFGSNYVSFADYSNQYGAYSPLYNADSYIVAFGY